MRIISTHMKHDFPERNAKIVKNRSKRFLLRTRQLCSVNEAYDGRAQVYSNMLQGPLLILYVMAHKNYVPRPGHEGFDRLGQIAQVYLDGVAEGWIPSSNVTQLQ